MRVIFGEVFDVAVDIRKSSRNFGKWISVNLSEKNKKQLWIPEGFAHGFITTSKNAELHYKTNNFWNKDSERTIIWNDQDLNIDWNLENLKIKKPILSVKDLDGKSLLKIKKESALF